MLIVTGSVTARTDTFEALLKAALAHVAQPGSAEFMAAVEALAQSSTRLRILPVAPAAYTTSPLNH